MENDIGECDGNRDYMGVGLEKEKKKLAATESPESFHASNPYTAKEMRCEHVGKVLYMPRLQTSHEYENTG